MYNQNLRDQILARSEVRHNSGKADLIAIYKERYGEANTRGKNTPAWRQELTKDLKAQFPNEKNIHRNFQGGRENKEAGKKLQPKLDQFAKEQAKKEEKQPKEQGKNPYIASVAPASGGYGGVRSAGGSTDMTIGGDYEIEREIDSADFDQSQLEAMYEALAANPGDAQPIVDAYMHGSGVATYESGDFELY